MPVGVEEEIGLGGGPDVGIVGKRPGDVTDSGEPDPRAAASREVLDHKLGEVLAINPTTTATDFSSGFWAIRFNPSP
jgi:hypothetical protein